jgi:hypothetical protein
MVHIMTLVAGSFPSAALSSFSRRSMADDGVLRAATTNDQNPRCCCCRQVSLARVRITRPTSFWGDVRLRRTQKNWNSQLVSNHLHKRSARLDPRRQIEIDIRCQRRLVALKRKFWKSSLICRFVCLETDLIECSSGRWFVCWWSCKWPPSSATLRPTFSVSRRPKATANLR